MTDHAGTANRIMQSDDPWPTEETKAQDVQRAQVHALLAVHDQLATVAGLLASLADVQRSPGRSRRAGFLDKVRTK